MSCSFYRRQPSSWPLKDLFRFPEGSLQSYRTWSRSLPSSCSTSGTLSKYHQLKSMSWRYSRLALNFAPLGTFWTLKHFGTAYLKTFLLSGEILLSTQWSNWCLHRNHWRVPLLFPGWTRRDFCHFSSVWSALRLYHIWIGHPREEFERMIHLVLVLQSDP